MALFTPQQANEIVEVANVLLPVLGVIDILDALLVEHDPAPLLNLLESLFED